MSLPASRLNPRSFSRRAMLGGVGACGLAASLLLASLLLGTTPVQAEPPTASPKEPLTLAVAAASDLKFAMDEVVTAFKKSRPDIAITVTYGSSGNFFGQLSNKAPFDMFFSADVSYPKQLGELGLVVEGSQFLYAEGHVVLWVPKSSPLDVEKRGIKALEDPSVRKIAIANPKTAPYGRAAEAALKSLGEYEAVKDRLVFGDNIAHTAQFVQSGSADVGILALSLAVAPALQAEGRYWPIPSSAHPRLEQAGVTLKWVKSPEAAQAFKGFFTGPEGRTILKRYGFVLPGE